MFSGWDIYYLQRELTVINNANIRCNIHLQTGSEHCLVLKNNNGKKIQLNIKGGAEKVLTQDVQKYQEQAGVQQLAGVE